jgi:hypothetical protein
MLELHLLSLVKTTQEVGTMSWNSKAGWIVLCAPALLLAAGAVAAPPSTKPVEGLRDNTPAVWALTNARIVTEPGKVIDKGTVVVRDGVIAAVGADVPPPADARVLDMAGKTIYPGLIDAFGEVNVTAEQRQSSAPHWNSLVTPQLDLAEHYKFDDELNKKLRSQGITRGSSPPPAASSKEGVPS